MKSNDTHINILCSYAYAGRNRALTEKLVTLSRSGFANIMLDSGAFTAHNALGNFSHVNVDAYTEYCEAYGEEFEKYVMLDVIGNERQSKLNYEHMVKKGTKPMFVVTMFDNDFGYVNDTLSINPNICVAGGADTKSDWLIKRYQDVWHYTEHRCRTHGLAFITYPKMLQLPLASVDSASWNLAPAKYGNILLFDCKKGITAFSSKEILKERHVDNPSLVKFLEFCGVKPIEFCNIENHKRKNSIQLFLSIVSMQFLQRYCYKRGLRYFMAVSSIDKLNKIEYVARNFNDLHFKDFKEV